MKAKTEARINELKAEIQNTLASVGTLVEECNALVGQAPEVKKVQLPLYSNIATIKLQLLKFRLLELKALPLDKAKAVENKLLALKLNLKV